MITAARRQAAIAAAIIAPPRAAELGSRTRALLRGAIVPTLVRLAWPNILVMLAQASMGLIETWWALLDLLDHRHRANAAIDGRWNRISPSSHLTC
jgi:hypothetical protein